MKGSSRRSAQSVCDYWLDYAERHQINEFCTAYLKQAREAIAPMLRFPLVWPPEERALTADEVRAAARLVATIHQDLRSETFKKIPFRIQGSPRDVRQAIVAPRSGLARAGRHQTETLWRSQFRCRAPRREPTVRLQASQARRRRSERLM